MIKTVMTLEKIGKTFDGTFRAVKDVSLTIKSGEFLVLLGPSGSGKSTLLRIMSGLEKEFTGKLTLAKDVHASEMGFVFQQFGLLPWLTVEENIRFALLSRRLGRKEQDARVHRELKRLGLQKFANVHPRELSGGLRQRVGIARALAIDPKIIFMDEPFSELDSFTAEELRQELLRIWQESKMTIVMVTHLVPEAIELADRVVVLTPRPARIEKIVPIDLPRPRAKRSNGFFAMEDTLERLVRP